MDLRSLEISGPYRPSFPYPYTLSRSCQFCRCRGLMAFQFAGFAVVPSLACCCAVHSWRRPWAGAPPRASCCLRSVTTVAGLSSESMSAGWFQAWSRGSPRWCPWVQTQWQVLVWATPVLPQAQGSRRSCPWCQLRSAVSMLLSHSRGTVAW
jgi:hypothetical protein